MKTCKRFMESFTKASRAPTFLMFVTNILVFQFFCSYCCIRCYHGHYRFVSLKVWFPKVFQNCSVPDCCSHFCSVVFCWVVLCCYVLVLCWVWVSWWVLCLVTLILWLGVFFAVFLFQTRYLQVVCLKFEEFLAVDPLSELTDAFCQIVWSVGSYCFRSFSY